MQSGAFGAYDGRQPKRKAPLARRLLDREMGAGNQIEQQLNQGYIAQVRHTVSQS